MRTAADQTGVSVFEVLPGTPAEDEGVRPGMAILEVHGVDVRHCTQPEVVEQLKKGATVSLLLGVPHAEATPADNSLLMGPITEEGEEGSRLSQVDKAAPATVGSVQGSDGIVDTLAYATLSTAYPSFISSFATSLAPPVV